MSLSERIQEDLVRSLKSKESERVSVLRMVKSALKNKEIELSKPLSVEQENQLLQTLVKQRNESIETYEKAGRSELAAKEKRERDVIREYLPEEVTAEEIDEAVSKAVSELGASSMKEMGAVMKKSLEILRETGKTVDGKVVNAAVRAKLS